MTTLRMLLVLMVAAIAATAACKIDNPDHCANQDAPGNDWCTQNYASFEYCSPCEGNNSGCVRYEPFNCEDYDRDEQNGA